MILHAFRQRRGETGSVETAEPIRDLLSFKEPRDAVSAAVRRAQLDALLGPGLVTAAVIYGFGVISRPMHCRFRLGPDSLLALAVFGLGIAGLFAVPH